MDYLPTLNAEDIIQLQKSNFDFTEEFYKKFHECIRQNPGKTILELLPFITFYEFTSFQLLLAFKLFNTYKNTYYNKCGPFLRRAGLWFVAEKNKNLQEQEISNLKQEISNLKQEISNLNKKLNHLGLKY